MRGTQPGLLPAEGWQCPGKRGWALSRPESTLVGLSAQPFLLPLHCPLPGLLQVGATGCWTTWCVRTELWFPPGGSSLKTPLCHGRAPRTPRMFPSPLCHHPQCSPVEATLHCVGAEAVLVLEGFLSCKIGLFGV